MVKKVSVGHWECEYCGSEFSIKASAEKHEKEDCQYRYDRYE